MYQTFHFDSYFCYPVIHSIKTILLTFDRANLCVNTFRSENITPVSLKLAKTQLVLNFDGSH